MAGIAHEVKTEILAKVKAGEKVAELSKQYGISEQSIYSWLKQNVTGMVSVLEHNKLKKENEWLKQIITGKVISHRLLWVGMVYDQIQQP